jgi:hypothetical protein
VPLIVALDRASTRTFIRRIAQIWFLLVVVGSLQPARPVMVVGLHAAGLHRYTHWLAFAGSAFLLLLLSRNRRQEFQGVVATCLLGLSLEYLQHFTYRNPMEWVDVRDDTAAILAAFALFRLSLACRDAFSRRRLHSQSGIMRGSNDENALKREVPTEVGGD